MTQLCRSFWLFRTVFAVSVLVSAVGCGSGGVSSSAGTGGQSTGSGGQRSGTGGTTTTGTGGAATTGTGGMTTTGTGGMTTTGTGGMTTTGTGGMVSACASGLANLVRISEVDVGGAIALNEDDAGLKHLTLSAIPSGGSRLAWMGTDKKVHITQLDAADKVTGTPLALVANDYADMLADDAGGVLMLSRDALGGGTLNCGQPTNLCGTPPSPAVPCYDMYMVRFDGAAETWATKLTTSSATLPPYSTSKTGPEVSLIWWYGHHGRIAFDGSRYAAYFGFALSVSEGGCINIHQADMQKVLGTDGKIQTGGFDLGCSHTGYNRVAWDATAKKFVPVCLTDNMDRIAIAPNYTTIASVDRWYTNLGSLVAAPGGGFWLTSSAIRSGQPANSDGLADVHLLHFGAGAADKNLTLASDAALNVRAPHLAAYGTTHLIAAWETSTAKGDLAMNDKNRKLYVQILNATTGAAEGPSMNVSVSGHRYQDFRSFSDGSVAFPAAGSANTKVKILRVLPCGS